MKFKDKVITHKMDPRKILRGKISLEAEKNKTSSFFSRGRDYCVDELVIERLYEVYKDNIKHINIYSYEDKIEIKKAYPSFFNFEQNGPHYKVTKKIHLL